MKASNFPIFDLTSDSNGRSIDYRQQHTVCKSTLSSSDGV